MRSPRRRITLAALFCGLALVAAACDSTKPEISISTFRVNADDTMTIAGRIFDVDPGLAHVSSAYQIIWMPADVTAGDQVHVSGERATDASGYYTVTLPVPWGDFKVCVYAVGLGDRSERGTEHSSECEFLHQATPAPATTTTTTAAPTTTTAAPTTTTIPGPPPFDPCFPFGFFDPLACA